jgi:phage terminase large subunit
VNDSETILPEQKPYQPYGGAEQLFYCKEKYILIEGPAGTGKTRAILEKVNLCASKYPGIRALFVRKTRKSLTESVLVTFEEKVLPSGSPILAGPTREHRNGYHYPNGSTIVVGGMDNPDRIMSTEYDIICSFESTELTEDDGEKITTRLRNGMMPYQQWIADCNPGAPTHWLNQRANAGKMHRILSRHKDNPTITQDYLNTLNDLTGARHSRLYKGLWAAQEGMVYDYDAAIHLINTITVPSSWTKFRIIDFGYTNPFVCQWWAQDPDDRIYRYREIYFTKRLVRDHAMLINQLSKGERFSATIADHDAEDRATLHAEGIHTIAAIKDISPGIQAVQQRLKIRGDGKPGLFLIRDSLVERDESLAEAKKPTCTEQEFDSYVWPKGMDGKPIKEAPVKVDDHGMDCVRYLCMYLQKGAKKHPAIIWR